MMKILKRILRRQKLICKTLRAKKRSRQKDNGRMISYQACILVQVLELNLVQQERRLDQNLTPIKIKLQLEKLMGHPLGRQLREV